MSPLYQGFTALCLQFISILLATIKDDETNVLGKESVETATDRLRNVSTCQKTPKEKVTEMPTEISKRKEEEFMSKDILTDGTTSMQDIPWELPKGNDVGDIAALLNFLNKLGKVAIQC